MRKKELALEVIRRLKEEYPDTWVHTHLCENKDEIAWVKNFILNMMAIWMFTISTA